MKLGDNFIATEGGAVTTSRLFKGFLFSGLIDTDVDGMFDMTGGRGLHALQLGLPPITYHLVF